MSYLIENWYVLLPFASFFVMLIIWYRHGRDPKGTGNIIPYYNVPEGLTPIQAGLIVHSEIKARDVASTLIFLAVSNQIKIDEIEKRGQKDFLITKMEEKSYYPDGAEGILYSALFADDDKVLLSDMEEVFKKIIPSMIMLANRSVVKKGYFEERPHRMQRATIIVGTNLCLFSAIFIFLGYGLAGIVSLIISFTIIAVFAALMPKLTRKGIIKKEEILGFKLYLETAEKERIAFHNEKKDSESEEVILKKYEKLLPYAISLGVENRILYIIDEKCDHFPKWFHGFEAVSSHGILHGITNFDKKISRMFLR